MRFFVCTPQNTDTAVQSRVVGKAVGGHGRNHARQVRIVKSSHDNYTGSAFDLLIFRIPARDSSLRRGDDCRVSLKRENKTAQTLSIVVGGFIACWLFFFIVYLITPFLPDDTIPSSMMKWLTWLGEYTYYACLCLKTLVSVDAL